MSKATYSALKLIRSTCANLKKSVPPAEAEVLGRMDIVLARLLAEESSVVPLKARVAKKAVSILGGDDDIGFDEAMSGLNELVKQLDTKTTALQEPTVIQAINIEQAYWRHYSERVQDEIRGSTVVPDEVPSTFNIEGVQSFLRQTFTDMPNLAIVGYSLASLGFSKKTVLLTLSDHGDLPAEIALRIDQPFNFLGTTVLDEYEVLVNLWQQGIRLPRPLALEKSGDILGQPFIVFERATGSPVGSNFTAPPKNPDLIKDFARHLAQLHKVPVEKSGLPDDKCDLDKNLDQEIEGSYRDWQALGMDSATVEAGFKWVRANRHLGSGDSAVVHNDYNFNNILVEDNKVSAILDWEFVHVGHPAADLGYFYFSAEKTASFDVFISEYEKSGGVLPGRDVMDFYILFGQLRLLIMVFQSEAGFVNGNFSDIRYGITGALFLPISIDRVSNKILELIE